MSHEIRTSMNDVIGVAQLLLETELTAAWRIDGRQVVTHWGFCDRLANEFPHATGAA